jgi:plastocyanin
MRAKRKPITRLRADRATTPALSEKLLAHALSRGINTTLTSATFVGTKSVTVTLKKGSYTCYCAVHPTMTGSFKVS